MFRSAQNLALCFSQRLATIQGDIARNFVGAFTREFRYAAQHFRTFQGGRLAPYFEGILRGLQGLIQVGARSMWKLSYTDASGWIDDILLAAVAIA
jgi:hypothetical protein